MKQEPRAVIILYVGTELGEATIAQISAIMAKNCNLKDDIELMEMNSEDVAKAIIADESLLESVISIFGTPISSSDLTLEEKAIVFIGEKMKDSLTKQSTEKTFLYDLMQTVRIALEDPNSKDSMILFESMQVLSKENLKISPKLLKKYNLNEKKISAIKDVWDLIKKE